MSSYDMYDDYHGTRAEGFVKGLGEASEQASGGDRLERPYTKVMQLVYMTVVKWDAKGRASTVGCVDP